MGLKGIRTATITIDEGKVLLVKSKYDDGEYYLFPGGGLEFGETIKEGAIRETAEETGINVKIDRLVHVNEFIYRKDWDKRSVAVFFLSSPKKEPKKDITDDGGKIKKIEWVELSKLDKLNVRPAIVAKILKESGGNLSDVSLEYSVDFKE